MQTLINSLTASLAHTSLQGPRPYANLEIPAETRKRLLAEISKTELKPAAVLVGILPLDQQAASIVLTQRSEKLRNHPGQISFPGGRMEDRDESLQHTALRESEEEINLPTSMVKVLGYLPDYPTVTGFRVTPVVGLLDANAQDIMQPDGLEATEIIHIPVSRALDPDAYEKRYIERNGLKVPIFHLQHEQYNIWGATAGMLYQLCLHYCADKSSVETGR